MLGTGTFAIFLQLPGARMPDGTGRRDQKKDSFLFDRFCIAIALATGIPDKGELVITGMLMMLFDVLKG